MRSTEDMKRDLAIMDRLHEVVHADEAALAKALGEYNSANNRIIEDMRNAIPILEKLTLQAGIGKAEN